MERSKRFDQVKGYYDDGLWSKGWLRNAVVKGWITGSEYEEITGETYA